MNRLGTFLKSAVVALVSLASLLSCEPEMKVTTFEPKMVIQGGVNEVVSGAEFSFRIYSATGKIIINSIEIRRDDGEVAYSPDRASNDFPIQGITLGNEINCREDGWAGFSAASVYVPKKSVYTLTVTVSEPSTANKVTLKDTFRGRTTLDVREVMVTGFCKDGQVITTGDVLNVETKFSKTAFRLDKYHIPEGCGVVAGDYAPVEGKEYNLPEDCVWRFSVSCDNIVKDATDSLSFDFTDMDSGRKTHFRYGKDILCCRPFDYSMQCGDVDSSDGKLDLVITTGRTTFTPVLLEVTADKPDKLRCNGRTLESMSDPSFTTFFGAVFRDDRSKALNIGETCTFGSVETDSQALHFVAENIQSSVDQGVRLRFILKDARTGMQKEEKCSFKVRSSTVPSDVQMYYIDKNGNEKIIGKASDNDCSVYVSCYDSSPEGKKRGVTDIRFRFLSAEGSAITSPWSYDAAVDSPSSAELEISEDAHEWGTMLKERSTGPSTGESVLYVKGGTSAGEKKIKITVTNPKTSEPITFTMKVYVRRRCAIVIDGSVINKTDFCDSFYNIGWKGLISEDDFCASINEYKLYSDKDRDPLYEYVQTHASAATCPDIEDFVSFYPVDGAEASFYGEMKWHPGHRSPVFYGELQGEISKLRVEWWADGGWHWWFPYAGETTEWPKTEGTGANKLCQVQTTADDTPAKSYAELARIVNYYCDNCNLVCYHRYTREARNDFYTDYPELKPTEKMSFIARDVAWTDKTLDIRYVVYRFKNNKNYWWSGFDEGVWYQTVEDIPIRG